MSTALDNLTAAIGKIEATSLQIATEVAALKAEIANADDPAKVQALADRAELINTNLASVLPAQ